MRHDSVARFVSTLLQIGPTKINCTERKIRRCRALQRAKELRGTVMPRLRRLSGLCSSNVSDTANRLRKTRKKKSSVVPLFRSGHMSAICARLSNKGKVGVQRGRETAGCPSSLPPRRVPRRSRAPQTANPPLRFSGKLSAPSGRTRLRQFVFPSHPVQEKGAVRTAPISPGKQ